MEDLLRIREPLDAFARARAHEIVIVSNNRAKFDSLRGAFQAPMRYVEWSQTAFAAELNGAALVVIPITDNPFTRCKSNNRAATALWHGVPVMADTIPAYEELAPYAVLNDWAGGFAALASDPAALAPRTDAGRSYVRARFTTARIADDWAAAFEAILAEPARS